MTERAPNHYIPNTDAERRDMLDVVGAASIDDLFLDIPQALRDPRLDLPTPMSELDLRREMAALAEENKHLGQRSSFLGGGAYNHFIPSVVRALITRGEFLTAYTPYQPEVSQGTLQATFDFQTLVCNLLEMEVADAGMYDGATALAEAALMACRITGRRYVAALNTLSPTYRQVVATYTAPQSIEVTDIEPGAALPPEAACLLVQYPNFFGYVEDMTNLEKQTHDAGSLFVVSANPVAMALFKSPGAYNADIVTGEGQSLGIPISYGGPYYGLFASRMEYVRQIPGRIAGRTVDARGDTGYVLTLSAREQHIRRERATSNICTNQALMTLASTVYMAIMGKEGLRQAAELCYHKAHYAASLIDSLPGYSVRSDRVFFNEFVVNCLRPPSQVNSSLLERNIVGGLDISDQVENGMLVCVTEMNTREEIDTLASALDEAAK